MPFVLYERSEPRNWSPVGEVELAGESGPFALFIRTTAKTNSSFEWRLSESKVLAFLGVADIANCALVFEPQPNQPNWAPRARLREVSGFSDVDWTSVLIRMESWSTDSTQPQLSFASEQDSGTAYKLLHLNGGTVDQKWTWTSNADMNGPLLPPQALQFFRRLIDSDAWRREKASPGEQESAATNVAGKARFLKRSAAGSSLYTRWCRELETLLGPSREAIPADRSLSDTGARVDAQMCQDLEALLRPRHEEIIDIDIVRRMHEPADASSASPAPHNSQSLSVRSRVQPNDKDAKLEGAVQQAFLQWVHRR